MTRALPSCLVRLGLDLQADDRAIRRAYAQRLKQIDPHTDPRGFQSLRHAYESALHWHLVDRRAAPAPTLVQADEPPAQVATDEPPAQEVPAALPVPTPTAGPSVPELLDLLRHKLDAGELCTRDDVQAWLSATLDTETLIDLDARFAFERGVALLLAEGWTPGKELLFGPATDGFGWSQKDGHLAQFEHPGHLVAMAIRDLQVIEAQPDDIKRVMHDLVRQLRDGARPEPSVLRTRLPLLEQMVRSHPNWLHIVTDVSTIRRWREWERAATEARASPFKLHRVLIPLLMVLAFIWLIDRSSRPATSPSSSTAKPVAVAIGTLAPDTQPNPTASRN